MNYKHGLAEDGFATFSGWWEATGLLGTVAAISVERDGFIFPRRMEPAEFPLVLATCRERRVRPQNCRRNQLEHMEGTHPIFKQERCLERMESAS